MNKQIDKPVVPATPSTEIEEGEILEDSDCNERCVVTVYHHNFECYIFVL